MGEVLNERNLDFGFVEAGSRTKAAEEDPNCSERDSRL